MVCFVATGVQLIVGRRQMALTGRKILRCVVTKDTEGGRHRERGTDRQTSTRTNRRCAQSVFCRWWSW